MDPILRRGRRALGVLLAVLLVATGCTSLPMSGEVKPGREPGEVAGEPPTQFFAGAPTRGATPEEIVSGFVDAAISPLGSWETARLFLAGELQDTWRPEAGAIVDVADSRRPVLTEPAEPAEGEEDAREATVSLRVVPTAVVDEHGTYTASAGGGVDLPFQLRKQDNDQWRIVQAPDGIVIDRQSFPYVYGDHRLMYFDPTWTYLVPDVRWFPATGNAATYVVRELVDGAPSPWLAGSVVSAFAQDLDLQPDAVPVDPDQIAHVSFNQVASGLDKTALSRMKLQLTQSLINAGVQDVRLTVAGRSEPLSADELTQTQTRPDSRALVLRAGEFGFLSGSDMVPVDGLSAAIGDMEGQIDSISVSPDQKVAAVQQSTGIVYRVTSESPDQLDADRADLIAPLIDPFGYIWTVPSGKPGDVRAWDASLEPIPIEAGLAEASTVRAWAMSRDGSRIAALVTQGGEHIAVVASVRRDREGRPTALSGTMRTTELPGAGVDIAWIEDARLGIVARDDEAETPKLVVIDQQVGGPATRLDAPAGTVAIEFGTQDSTARLLSSTAQLYLRRQTSWQQTGDEVSVLATQMGTPQGADD